MNDTQSCGPSPNLTASKTSPEDAPTAAHACGDSSLSPRRRKRGRVCLLVVDAQYDFCQGALAAPQGVRIAERIGLMLEQVRRVNDRRSPRSSRTNACMQRNGVNAASCEELATEAAVEDISLKQETPGSSSRETEEEGGGGGGWCDLVVFSLDWHPANHVSFEASHQAACMHRVCCCGGDGALSSAAQGVATAAVEEATSSLGLDRKWTVVVNQQEAAAPHAEVVCLWPIHCVQGSKGAKLHPAVEPQIGDYVVRKATLSSEECFSACGTSGQPTGLVSLLRSKGVETVAICGFCLDYCVAATAVPLRAAGIPDVVVLTDFTAAIHQEKQQQTVLYLGAHKLHLALSSLRQKQQQQQQQQQQQPQQQQQQQQQRGSPLFKERERKRMKEEERPKHQQGARTSRPSL
ncbi:hypothetical protein Emed_005241 [Eimeria media]